MNASSILSVRGLGLRFGGVVALRSVEFDVPERSVTALIGPNGAGKTTVFNCVTGFYRASAGSIQYRSGSGEIEIRRLLGERLHFADFVHPNNFLTKIRYKMMGGSHLVAKAGVSRTFQNIRLFREMTCIENLLVAQHFRLDRNLVAGVISTAKYRASQRQALDEAFHWLDVIGLADKGNRLAGELPYGMQRRLEIARGLAAKPRLICLDEPAAGLNPRETADLSRLILRIRDEFDVTVLLVEHDMPLVMSICQHLVVLDRGAVIAEGSPEQVRASEEVIAAYLGQRKEPAQ